MAEQSRTGKSTKPATNTFIKNLSILDNFPAQTHVYATTYTLTHVRTTNSTAEIQHKA
jgi:hypothetical protein